MREERKDEGMEEGRGNRGRMREERKDEGMEEG